MTTAATTADTIAYHQERSWHFLSLVDDEIERGRIGGGLQQSVGRRSSRY